MTAVDELPAPPADIPRSRLTLGVRREVMLDKMGQALATRRVESPDEATLERIGLEVSAARRLFDERGWIADPRSYHVDPPPAEGVRWVRSRTGSINYERLTWESAYAPHGGEPGRARHLSHQSNAIARVAVLRRRSAHRPWLIVVHGWGMGAVAMDMRLMRLRQLHDELGVNIAAYTLPFHGRRKAAGASGMGTFPSADFMDDIHGFAQAVSDLRQLVTLLGGGEEAPIGLLGLSLGGYTAALTAGIEDRLHAVTGLVPVADLVSLMVEGSADTMDVSERERQLFDDLVAAATPLMSTVAPLSFPALVPHERRHIIAGTLDQFVKASTQAAVLWEHWDRPNLTWFHGGHIGAFFNTRARRAVHDGLRSAGLVSSRGRVPS